MKLINSKSWVILQEKGLLGVYKQIELAGRTAYKSEDKVTENSSEKFVNMLLTNGHYSPLEFGTVYLQIPTNINPEIIIFYDSNPYSRVNFDDEWYYVTTNARVIVENEKQDDLKYFCDYNKHFEQRITAKIICDRATGNEIVRHRAFSYCQESSRFCNYSKDKFNNQVQFVIPYWLDLEEGDYSEIWYDFVDDKNKIIVNGEVHRFDINDLPYKTEAFINHCSTCETTYLQSIKNGLKPQEARNFLPLSLKTEITMCGFISDWEHFFALRTAQSAHPDIQIIAKQLKEEICP